MDQQVEVYFNNLKSKDKTIQYEAYQSILKIVEKEVNWAYEVWDQLISDLSHSDNHIRSRAAQFLAHLAISDPEGRILDYFPALWNVTNDEKFVTARHSLQSIWRVGLAGEAQKEMLLTYLDQRYRSCTTEKHYTLIRFDIIQGLKFLYNHIEDIAIKQKAFELIELEDSNKYQKKYLAVWK